MRTLVIGIALLTLAVLVGVPARAEREAPKSDPFAGPLIQRYFAMHALKPSEYDRLDRDAIAWLIVRFARRSGEWRPLLERARKRCEPSVRMLGMMLAREASERKAVARWDAAWKNRKLEMPPGPREPVLRSNLRDEVLPVLRKLLDPPDPYFTPGVVLALVRSDHPALAEDCWRLLDAEGTPREAKFYAAAGLLRAGDEAGKAWLAEHAKGKGRVRSAPFGAKSRTLADACAVLLESPKARFVETLIWAP